MSSNQSIARSKAMMILGGIAAVILLSFILWTRIGGLPTVESEFDVELPPLDIGQVALVPEPRQAESERVLPEISPLPRTPQPEVTPTPEPLSSDADRLSLVTSNWVYRGFAGLGDEQQRGRFTHFQRGGEIFYASVGDVIEGVTISRLDRLSAEAQLGEATIVMALVRERQFTLEEMSNPEIPDEQRVRQAMTAYWEDFGKRAMEIGKRYTPQPGQIMPPPQPPSQEEAEAAKARYMATWAPHFEQMSSERTPLPGEIMPRPHRDPLEEQQAIEAYYRRFRPWATPPPPANRR